MDLPADRCKIPRTLWRSMVARGLPVAEALARAGVAIAEPDDPDAFLTTAEYLAFFRELDRLAADPALAPALVTAAEPVTAAHPPAMLAAFHSATYREAIDRVVRFKRLVRAELLEVEEAAGEVALTKTWPHATEPEPPLSVDLGFGMLVELGRRGSGRRIVPLRLELVRTAPQPEALAAYLGCAVTLGAARDRLVLRSIDVDLPFPGHQPELLALLLPALAAALAEHDATASASERVKWALKRGLGNGRQELAEIAAELGTSERTLQRRITEEGTTFRDLLADARQELARHLLASSGATIDEVAYLLGYRDTSSFHRAFREREGTTPARWRREHGASCQ